MKTFANIGRFEARLKKGIAWEDYFRLGGKMFNIYEYGPGPGVNIGYDYVMFRNKNTGEIIEVQYDCPSFQYIDGQRVQTKQYAFKSLEVYTTEPWR